MSYVLARANRHAKNATEVIISRSHMLLKNRPFYFTKLENVVCGSQDRNDAWRALLALGIIIES